MLSNKVGSACVAGSKVKILDPVLILTRSMHKSGRIFMFSSLNAYSIRVGLPIQTSFIFFGSYVSTKLLRLFTINISITCCKLLGKFDP